MTHYQPLLPFTAPPAARLPIDDAFPEALADRLARREAYNKHNYRPNTYLHKWWARRCGSTFRLILKSLVEDPLHRDYYAGGGLGGKLILDPMMGGGTTLHEAIRLGAAVVGIDIDPIPVVQARATLSDIALPALEEAFAAFYERVSAELSPYFTTHCPTCGDLVTVRFVLYGRRRSSADERVIVVDSLTLRHERDGSVLTIDPVTHAVHRDGALLHAPDRPPTARLVDKRTKRDAHGAPYRDHTDLPFYARYVPLVVVGDCPTHGRFYRPPDAHDRARLAAADAARPALPPAATAITPGAKSRHLLRQGIAGYDALFSSRQLLFITAAQRAVQAAPAPTQPMLALLVSTALEFNSMLCGYKGARAVRPGAIRHVFSHHAYAIPATALENNPLFPGHKASGTLTNLFHRRIRGGRLWAAAPTERRGRAWKVVRGEIALGDEVSLETIVAERAGRAFALHQGSAAAIPLPDDSVDHIVTDPPYFDSVQYSDLAGFFRVWLKALLPDSADWEYDTAGSAAEPQYSFNGNYAAVLSAIFAECARVLRLEHGRLIFTFHHWKPQAWIALTLALRRAGFRLVNRYVVHAENPVSVHIANLNALVHDVVLVLAAPAAGVAPPWPRPSAIATDDSARFCRECGDVLGWLLAADLTEEAITAAWHAYLPGT